MGSFPVPEPFGAIGGIPTILTDRLRGFSWKPNVPTGFFQCTRPAGGMTVRPFQGLREEDFSAHFCRRLSGSIPVPEPFPCRKRFPGRDVCPPCRDDAIRFQVPLALEFEQETGHLVMDGFARLFRLFRKAEARSGGVVPVEAPSHHVARDELLPVPNREPEEGARFPDDRRTAEGRGATVATVEERRQGFRPPFQ